MNCFEPLITNSSPCRSAVVRIAAASDPPVGSVSPKDGITVPAITPDK